MEPFEHITRLLNGPPPQQGRPPPEAAHDPTAAAARGQSAELLGQPPPPPSSAAEAQAAELNAAEPPDPITACVTERGGDPAYRDGGLPDPAEVESLTAGCEAEQQGHADRPEMPEPIATRRVLDALATGRWDTDSLAVRLTDAQLATLPPDERIALIDHIARGTWVGGEDEATLVRLVATAPEPSALLDRLSADRAALLRLLDAVIDGDAYAAYRRALRAAYFAAQTPAEVAAAMADPITLPWADPGLIGALLGERRVVYETVEYSDEGMIDIVGHLTAGPVGIPFERRGLDPLDLVAVRYFADEAAFEAGEGETQYMPAAEFVGLYHKQQGQMRAELGDLALVGLGGVGVAGAASRLGKAVAGIEAAIGAADLVIRSQRDAIGESEGGRGFLSVWDKVVTLAALSGAAQIAVSVPHFVAAAQKSWGRVAGRVNPAARRAVDEQLDALEGAADEARRAQAPASERPPGAGELDGAATLDEAAAPRVDEAGRIDDFEARPPYTHPESAAHPSSQRAPGPLRGMEEWIENITTSPNVVGDRDRLDHIIRAARKGETGEQGELQAVDRWIREGRTVEVLSDSTISGRTNPDFRVDGRLVEAKTRVLPLDKADYILTRIKDANQQIKRSGLGERGSAVIQLNGDAAVGVKLDAMDDMVKGAFHSGRGRSLEEVSIYLNGDLFATWSRTAEGDVVRTFP